MIKSASQSSLTNDVKYRSMSAGAVPSSEFLIQTSLIGNNTTAFVDFDVSSFNGVYRHLKFVTTTRGTSSGIAADEVLITFNGQGSTYYTHRMGSTSGGSVASSAFSGNYVSQNPRTSSGTLFFIGAEIDILDPFNSNKNTTVRSLFGGSGSSHNTIVLNSVAWFSTATVTNIRLSAEANYFGQGTRLSLYGVTV